MAVVDRSDVNRAGREWQGACTPANRHAPLGRTPWDHVPSRRGGEAPGGRWGVGGGGEKWSEDEGEQVVGEGVTWLRIALRGGADRRSRHARACGI